MKTLSPFLEAQFAGKQFLRLETVDSTNTFCLENPDIISSPGIVVYADRQEAGRGRMGRAWSQGTEGNLFASFVIHPGLSPSLVPSITLCAGLAVYRTLQDLGLGKCALKWPNDVLVCDKKVCGILCESRIVNEKITVVAGVGVNVCGGVEEFPSFLFDKVTTLEECGVSINRDTLLSAVTASFDKILVEMHSGSPAALFREWERVSCSLGREVRFSSDSREICGTVAGLDDLGRLLVKDNAGCLHTVLSGEVEYV